MDHVTYTLKRPIQDGDNTITELKFRSDVVAGDMRGIPMRDPMDYDDILKIAGRLCAQPNHVISKMSIADMKEVLELVGGFTGGGQTTGTDPSPS